MIYAETDINGVEVRPACVVGESIGGHLDNYAGAGRMFTPCPVAAGFAAGGKHVVANVWNNGKTPRRPRERGNEVHIRT